MTPPGLITRFLRVFFHCFYHQFAWTYDFVATVVSVGRWNRWIQAVVPFVAGVDILELGFGPGHLQEHLSAATNLRIVGLDESQQMALMAKHRLERRHLGPIRLARGRAQELPFPAEAFDSVVSTFPSEYIFDDRALNEVHRVLRDGGRFVVLPASWIIGKGLTDRGAALLFRVTHQVPPSPRQIFGQRLERTLRESGFRPEFETVEISSSLVLVVTAHKSETSPARQ